MKWKKYDKFSRNLTSIGIMPGGCVCCKEVYAQIEFIICGDCKWVEFKLWAAERRPINGIGFGFNFGLPTAGKFTFKKSLETLVHLTTSNQFGTDESSYHQLSCRSRRYIRNMSTRFPKNENSHDTLALRVIVCLTYVHICGNARFRLKETRAKMCWINMLALLCNPHIISYYKITEISLTLVSCWAHIYLLSRRRTAISPAA